jgi:hypothetical protein
MPQIHRFLRRGGYSYWNIYEYTPDLVADRFTSCDRFLQVQGLGGSSSAEKAGTDSLYGRFLEAEDGLEKLETQGLDLSRIMMCDRIFFWIQRERYIIPYSFQARE